jgi:uncharacterized membrane protein
VTLKLTAAVAHHRLTPVRYGVGNHVCDDTTSMCLIRFLCGPTFVLAGVMHFVIPKVYKRIVPPYLPAPEALVYISGMVEVAGGLGLMTRSKRRVAGYWLIATLIAVFPANVHVALNPDDFLGIPRGSAALWARLPFQAVFIAWVRGAMRAGRSREESRRRDARQDPARVARGS